MSKDLQKIEQNAAFEFLELLTGFIISENLLRGHSDFTRVGGREYEFCDKKTMVLIY